MSDEENNSSDEEIEMKLAVWQSLEKSGCPADWLRNSLYIIKLNNKELDEKKQVALLLMAIQNQELKSKLINECSKLEEATMEKFKNIFNKNTTKDVVTYRRLLKNLRYSADNNMHEFYQKIYRLVQKSMNLDPETDDASITKLAAQEFMEKIPKDISKNMRTVNFADGIKVAEQAEKIRSFNQLYLHEAQVNQLIAQTQSSESSSSEYDSDSESESETESNEKEESRAKVSNHMTDQPRIFECEFCGKKRHTHEYCYMKKDLQKRGIISNNWKPTDKFD